MNKIKFSAFVLLFFNTFYSNLSFAKNLEFKKSAILKISNNCYYLKLNIFNNSKEVMYITPGPDIMIVKSENGKRLEEIGIVANFGDLKISDFDKILPGENFEKTTVLNNSYAFFKNGWHTVMLPGGYYDPLKNVEHRRPNVYVKFYYSAYGKACVE